VVNDCAPTEQFVMETVVAPSSKSKRWLRKAPTAKLKEAVDGWQTEGPSDAASELEWVSSLIPGSQQGKHLGYKNGLVLERIETNPTLVPEGPGWIQKQARRKPTPIGRC